MNYSLNVKSSSIVHTLLSNCVKLLGKVQKLLIKCISYSVISKRIRVVSPKFYTARKNFTGPPVPTVPKNFKSEQDASAPCCQLLITLFRTLGNIQQAHGLAQPSLNSHLKNMCTWWFLTLNYFSRFIKSRKAIESGFD